MHVAGMLVDKQECRGEQIVLQEDFRLSRDCRNRTVAGGSMTCRIMLLWLGEVGEEASKAITCRTMQPSQMNGVWRDGLNG